jgi:hypothetical protein
MTSYGNALSCDSLNGYEPLLNHFFKPEVVNNDTPASLTAPASTLHSLYITPVQAAGTARALTITPTSTVASPATHYPVIQFLSSGGTAGVPDAAWAGTTLVVSFPAVASAFTEGTLRVSFRNFAA